MRTSIQQRRFLFTVHNSDNPAGKHLARRLELAAAGADEVQSQGIVHGDSVQFAVVERLESLGDASQAVRLTPAIFPTSLALAMTACVPNLADGLGFVFDSGGHVSGSTVIYCASIRAYKINQNGNTTL